jgi:hypothetical protein
MTGKHPYFPFYTGDWKKDPQLARCSVTTRGVWIELICSMHDAEEGSLTASIIELAFICRCTRSEMRKAIDELRATQAAEVAQTPDGRITIGCRRLIRKQEASKIARESGSKGGSQTARLREAIPEYENENEGLEKVRGFSRGEGIPLADADWFFWKCHANGWTNGGRPILDWKATIRSWWKGRFFPSQKQQQTFWNGAREPPMPIKSRNEKINQLNERKAELMRMDRTPEVNRELAQIQAQLYKL